MILGKKVALKKYLFPAVLSVTALSLGFTTGNLILAFFGPVSGLFLLLLDRNAGQEAPSSGAKGADHSE